MISRPNKKLPLFAEVITLMFGSPDAQQTNHELFDWMNANPDLEIGRLKAEEAVERRSTKWRPQDRLTERGIVRMKMAFRTGAASKAIAERFGINVKSMRKLLQEHGVK